MSIYYSSRGSFRKTKSFFQQLTSDGIYSELHKGGRKGVEALQAATPVESGETARSWDYEIEQVGDGYILRWINHHVNNGANIAVLLQYGHGTGTGGYVQGRDYINPSIQPIFDEIVDDVWKKVKSL